MNIYIFFETAFLKCFTATGTTLKNCFRTEQDIFEISGKNFEIFTEKVSVQA